MALSDLIHLLPKRVIDCYRRFGAEVPLSSRQRQRQSVARCSVQIANEMTPPALDADKAYAEHKETPHQRAGTLRVVFLE